MDKKEVCIIDFFNHYWALTRAFSYRTNFGCYKIVEIEEVSPPRDVPDHIKKPSYYKTGIPDASPEIPDVKNAEQISKMRDSCKLAANILQNVGKHLKVVFVDYEMSTKVPLPTGNYRWVWQLMKLMA